MFAYDLFPLSTTATEKATLTFCLLAILSICNVMSSIKLTVNHLYRQSGDQRTASLATARIFVGETLVATEEITGMTESPVSKYLHHSLAEGQPVRVEWDSEGVTAMDVSEVHVCPCCQHDEC